MFLIVVIEILKSIGEQDGEIMGSTPYCPIVI